MPIINTDFVVPKTPKVMNLIYSIEYICCILKNYGIYSQYKYIKRRRSVYGLSIDMIFGMFFSELLEIYLYAINFKFSNLSKLQYSQRYPLVYDTNGNNIPVSFFLLLNNIISVTLLFFIIKQFKSYYKTENIHQGLSKVFIVYIFLIIFLAFASFCICGNKLTGRLNINYIDHLDILLIFQKYFLSSFNMAPQLSLNFMCQYTLGLSSKFELLLGVSTLLHVIENLILLHSDKLKVVWFKIPINFQSLYTSCWNLLFISILLLQSHYFYLNNKVTVPTKKETKEKNEKEYPKLI